MVLPFAAAYFLSYALRSINAVLSAPLTTELHLSASELGLLSAAYLLTFAIMQIPLGALLDRHGPKRIEVMLMIAAVAGCLLSSFATSFVMLWIGRALIGIGVSACLMAAYKGFRLCFSADHQSSLASLMLMVGSLGALVATVPVELSLPLIGWRGVFLVCALLLLLSAIGIAWLLPALPEPPPKSAPFWNDAWHGARIAYQHREIQRLVPFAIFTQGGFLAIQGLWMGPWFRIVEQQSSGQAATSLLITGIVVMLSHMGMSWMGTRFKQWGWSLDSVIRNGCLVMLVLSAVAIFRVIDAPLLLWSLMVAATAVTGISYAKANLSFSAEMTGRASTALNFVVFVGAFVMQWGLGLIVDALRLTGLNDAQSLIGAFMFWLAGQLFALLWFWFLPYQSATEHPSPDAVRSPR